MRDLRKDLEICNKATRGPWVFDEYDVDIWSQADPWRVANVGLHTDMEFIAAAREGWPYAIERAIKAEAENAQLRKVVDAARGLFLGEGEHLCSEFEDAMNRLGQALAELDKEES